MVNQQHTTSSIYWVDARRSFSNQIARSFTTEVQVYEFSCFEKVQSCKLEKSPSLICIRLELGELPEDALRPYREFYPGIPLAVCSQDQSPALVVRALRAGACNFLGLPFSTGEFIAFIQSSRREVDALTQLSSSSTSLGKGADALLGRSLALSEVKKNIFRLRSSCVNILLQGESGTGKELIAQAIHQSSPLAAGELVTVNCAAIPRDLAESVFFGHERGSFTGATSRHTGLLERANGGTLFLDEVADMAPRLQAKLLRALQDHRYCRLGGEKVRESRFRVIAASHAPLAEAVSLGQFRSDLFYRLATFEFEVPPLRERESDVLLLTQSFLNDLGSNSSHLSIDVKDLLCRYKWPGNVRELRSALEYASLMSAGDSLRVEHFPRRIRKGHQQAASQLRQLSDNNTEPAEQSLASPADELVAESLRSFKDFERKALLKALDKHDGNVSAVARSLGIGRTTVYRKLKRLQLADG